MRRSNAYPSPSNIYTVAQMKSDDDHFVLESTIFCLLFSQKRSGKAFNVLIYIMSQISRLLEVASDLFNHLLKAVEVVHQQMIGPALDDAGLC